MLVLDIPEAGCPCVKIQRICQVDDYLQRKERDVDDDPPLSHNVLIFYLLTFIHLKPIKIVNIAKGIRIDSQLLVKTSELLIIKTCGA